jgi:predicted nucleic acid-binding protein
MILDTSILIEILSDNSSIVEKLERVGESISTTVITKYELLKAPKEADVLALLGTMSAYDYDGKSAERAAKIFKDLKKKGKMINELDILIASIAMTHDEMLVTRDNDFKSVEHLKLLVL